MNLRIPTPAEQFHPQGLNVAGAADPITDGADLFAVLEDAGRGGPQGPSARPAGTSAMGGGVTAPPLRRAGQACAAQHYLIACTSSARVLEAEGHPASAQTLRRVGAHVAATPKWPAEVCMCAIVPCTEQAWAHPGHCCRTEHDHCALFEQVHTQICMVSVHAGDAR